MELKPDCAQEPVDLTDDECTTENGERAYVKMPQLSDRCGGSRNDSFFVPIPDGIVLPERVTVINIDDEECDAGKALVYEITDENFEAEVVNSEIPCIIEFTAGWCTLCDEMTPVFEELSGSYEGTVKFCLVNTDKQKKLRIKFAVACTPYIVMVYKGMKTPLFDELVTSARLKERIDFMLAGGNAPTTRPL